MDISCSLQIQADDIRSQVYDIHTWGEELSSWWKGTSSTMSIICNDLTKLRAALAVSLIRCTLLHIRVLKFSLPL